MGPMDKLELILSKINNEIEQDDFNDKIKNVIDLRELTGLATKENLLSKRDAIKKEDENTLDNDLNSESLKDSTFTPVKKSKKQPDPVDVAIV